MQDLKVALVQSELVWEDTQANLEQFDHILRKARESHIFLLPEMFNTGFTMNAEANAESMSGGTVKWMKDISKDINAVVSGSVIIEERGKYFNRLIWAEPSGHLEYYDKAHLFGMGSEDKHYSGGGIRKTITYLGWKLRLNICYDLRFPVWCRNEDQYDVMLFVANWPEKRIEHWRQLLKARAIENQAYCLGVNRIGEDGKGIVYNGCSAIISPMGEVEHELQDESNILYSTLSKEKIAFCRRAYPFLMDMDNFELNPTASELGNLDRDQTQNDQ